MHVAGLPTEDIIMQAFIRLEVPSLQNRGPAKLTIPPPVPTRDLGYPRFTASASPRTAASHLHIRRDRSSERRSPSKTLRLRLRQLLPRSSRVPMHSTCFKMSLDSDRHASAWSFLLKGSLLPHRECSARYGLVGEVLVKSPASRSARIKQPP